MDILSQSFGEYQTNCYICKLPQGEIVIDAGMGAYEWVIESAPKPLAFLNTHGHFDHIWSNAALKSHFPTIPLVCPSLDAFMLESDCFHTGITPSKPDILTQCNKNAQTLNFNGVEVTFWHFPGHTPGCSIVEIEGEIFSGDFIFYRSIGRSDFPYSSVADMKNSLERFRALPSETNKPIHPGHGISTNLLDEQHNATLWITYLNEG
ncbi:MBL fold metallo-hydrolase [Helicobacter jaachi]|uniref:MBL fold metallo-hydrolase n=1 Tax=Helicobacter jaachi TaxID=1677920 RepID=A0A4U8TBW3_9HELI|nr:MBL fold metallo-hydrolase [Helicobacter jaachi]